MGPADLPGNTLHVIIGRKAPLLKLEGDRRTAGKHARLTVATSGTTIEDLGSTSGTWVNGVKISGPVLLSPGDQIKLGETLVVFDPPTPSISLVSGSSPTSGKGKEKKKGEEEEEEEEAAATPVLEIHHINVGQGDATLIQIRNGRGALTYSMLIDTGRTGLETVRYLDKLISQGRFRRIDACVISHYDSDHIGGASVVFLRKYLQDDVRFYDLGVPLDSGVDGS